MCPADGPAAGRDQSPKKKFTIRSMELFQPFEHGIPQFVLVCYPTFRRLHDTVGFLPGESGVPMQKLHDRLLEQQRKQWC